ncbi:MAG: hypothetical protein MUO77_15820 [Anaerolineales bacterium]|nr:hypothetical protein [Anaerolineales bacterium]
MSIPQVLEVAIGLIVVYYVLGSIVSLITQWINEAFETRSVALERYLKKIAGDKVIDLTNLPQMKALRPIRYKNWFSVFGAFTEPKKIEKIPVATLVDAYFDIAGLTANKNINAEELLALINKLPDSEGKTAFVNWINQGVTNITDLRTRTTAYFTGMMDQAAATFKANARSFVIMLSIAITLLLGTDSIQLARDLWSNAELRAIAAAQADAVVAQKGVNADLTSLIKDLGAFSIKIGWWRQTENLPKNPATSDWAIFVVLKFIGLCITAAAVSQGSSFWYDLLKKLTAPVSSSTSASSSSGDGSSSSSNSSEN